MRKLLAAALALLTLAAPAAAAQKSKAQINAEIDLLFQDNATGQITPLKLRTVTHDIVDSYLDSATLLVGLDSALCATRGSVAVRLAASWACLTPGVAGQVLSTNGVGADPSWINAPIFTPSPLTRTDDTNVTLVLGGSPTIALGAPVSLTLGWNGTLAAGRLNSNVVQGVTNDTNVTGSIAGQNLTLGWTGTLAAGRLNANVVQGVTNDTNVTGSIAGQNLTLGWTGQCSVARGCTGQSTAPGARSSSGLNIDSATSTGDANYTILPADRFVYHTALSAARTNTLPAANAVNAGQLIVMSDIRGVATASNTVTLQRAGSDTVNGSTSFTAISAAYGISACWSDGTSRWNCQALGGSGGGGGVSSITIAAGNGIGISGTCTITTSGTCTIAVDTSFFQNYLAGLGFANNVLDANNDVDVSTGVAADSTNTILIKLTSALTKQKDAPWVVGNNQGCWDTGSFSSGTVHYWLIYRSDTGVSDILCSASASAPTMPTNYTHRRLVNSIPTISSNLVSFTQIGNDFTLTAPFADDTTGSVGSGSRLTITLDAVPKGIVIKAKLKFYAFTTSLGTTAYISSLFQTDAIVSVAGNANFRDQSVGSGQVVVLDVYLNTSGQFGVRGSAAITQFDTVVMGWTNTRGQ